MEITNQKEYLKKYLSGSGKEGKKKKKKKNFIGDRVTIIDDDIDLSQLETPEQAIDLFNTNEDAPQVVGVIDERPMHLRIKDYSDSNLWKPLGDQANTTFSESSVQKTSFQLKNKKGDSILQFKQLNLQKLPTLGRKNNIITKSNSSKVKQDGETIVFETSPTRKDSHTPDNSPPRRQVKDSSPPRRKQRSPDPNSASPKQRTPDVSPPRRSRTADSSPPRKRRKSLDSSPPRKGKEHSGNSALRQNKSEKRRNSRSPAKRNEDNSPHRRNDRNSTPPKKPQPFEVNEKNRKVLPGDKRGKYLIPAKRTDKMTKTLDGKTAGLQNAQELIKETQDFRKREDSLFKAMAAEVSGVNASTIVRDRKTGKIRDFAKEAEERKEKEKQEEETKEKYMRWGKGLKQVENYQEQLAQDLLEMNKPLARYADDEDLERYLKEREREEDPMLQYIRRKKKKKDLEVGKPAKPQYLGEFMPNRYAIVPGHRWDGVDRSNGYEKKWLDAQNAKQAMQEDIYKWSTEDM